MVWYRIIWYGYMVWHGMVNASVASQRPSIKTATALPLQLLPEKTRNFEGNCFPCLFSLSHCQYFLQKMSQIYFNANIYCQKICEPDIFNKQKTKNWVALKCLNPPLCIICIMPSSHFLAKPPLMAVAAISCGKLSLQEEGEATEEKEEEKQEEEQEQEQEELSRRRRGRDCFSLRRKKTREDSK